MPRLLHCLFVSILGVGLCSSLSGQVLRDAASRDQRKQEPLTLEEAIERALQNSREIEIARQGVKISESELKLAKGRDAEVARKRISLGEAMFRYTTVRNIERVQSAYWDLVYAARELAIYMDNILSLQRLSAENETLLARGMLDPLDRDLVNAQLSNLEISHAQTMANLTFLESDLKYLITSKKEDPLWSVSVVPTTPIAFPALRASLDEALEAGMKNRGDLQMVKVRLEINTIEQDRFRERRKERELERSQREGEQLAAEQARYELQIGLEVRYQVQLVNNAERLVRTASDARVSLETLHASEKKKFDTGESNTRQILESYNSLTAARLRELRAQSELAKSIAKLQGQTGSAVPLF